MHDIMSRRSLDSCPSWMDIMPIAAIAFMICMPAVLSTEVGGGLQKNLDSVVIQAGKTVCVPYAFGNPGDVDLKMVLIYDESLGEYISSEPEPVHVPSKTMRINSTCCLIPTKICFKAPFNLREPMWVSGTIASKYSVESQQDQQGTGSAVGSTIHYKLTLKMQPSEKYLKYRFFYDHKRTVTAFPIAATMIPLAVRLIIKRTKKQEKETRQTKNEYEELYNK